MNCSDSRAIRNRTDSRPTANGSRQGDRKDVRLVATTVGIARHSRLRAFWGSLDRAQKRSLAMMAAVVAGLHVRRVRDALPARRPPSLRARLGGRIHGRDRDHGLHARDAPCVRRRPHRGDRQHDAQADGRGQAAAERRLLVLAGPLVDRLRAGAPALDRDPLARRAGRQRQLRPARRDGPRSGRSSPARSST